VRPGDSLPVLRGSNVNPLAEGRLTRVVKAKKVSSLKPKKKCCRSKTRCVKCPVVIMRMKKAENEGLSGKRLQKALKRARAA
jgi:hypothetical protein